MRSLFRNRSFRFLCPRFKYRRIWIKRWRLSGDLQFHSSPTTVWMSELMVRSSVWRSSNSFGLLRFTREPVWTEFVARGIIVASKCRPSTLWADADTDVEHNVQHSTKGARNEPWNFPLYLGSFPSLRIFLATARSWQRYTIFNSNGGKFWNTERFQRLLSGCFTPIDEEIAVKNPSIERHRPPNNSSFCVDEFNAFFVKQLQQGARLYRLLPESIAATGVIQRPALWRRK